MYGKNNQKLHGKNKQPGCGEKTQLLLSYIGPLGPISRATLTRLTLNVRTLSGIDTTKYKGHIALGEPRAPRLS